MNTPIKGRLHCDECGHTTSEVVELTEAMIDTPCPKCDANMLSRAQYEEGIQVAGALNLVLSKLGITPPNDYVGAAEDSISIGLNLNTGKLRIWEPGK